MLEKMRHLLKEQHGAVSTTVAVCLVAFLGATALTLDIGHLVTAKGELQRGADAGALAGARALCINAVNNIPNWSGGTSAASNTVTKNKLDGALISDSSIQPGFWNLTWNWNTAPKGADGTINLLPQSTVPTALIVPAVRVRIDKKAGANSGPLKFSFASILGIANSSPAAQAVAAALPDKTKGIKQVPADSCFPFATPISWVQNWMQNHYNDNPPMSFRIGSDYHSPDGGQWTSFLSDANNVPTIRELIDDGNPTPLKVGDPIWIEPGTKTTLYEDMATQVGKTGLLPIVADNFDTHATTPILAFVAFYVEAAEGGSSKYIQGHFVKDYVDYDATSGGSSFGASGMSPNTKLVN